MDPPTAKVVKDFTPLILVYDDGHVERLVGNDIVPPFDPTGKVISKDVRYSSKENLFSRLYIPKHTKPFQKLPLLVYFHGGGFCVETPFSHTYHNYLNLLAHEANVIVVSVDYRRAPEDPLPDAYNDSWTALRWVASHFSGVGPEYLLNAHADFGKVFLAGDSSGANIAHHMSIKYGQEKRKLFDIKIIGIVLAHPYFWGKEPLPNEVTTPAIRAWVDGIWLLACPSSSGSDDPLINVVLDPQLASVGSPRMLVFVAEKDWFRYRGWNYYDNLKKSGWGGEIEIVETEGEGHVFHLVDPYCEKAMAMLRKIASYLNQAS